MLGFGAAPSAERTLRVAAAAARQGPNYREVGQSRGGISAARLAAAGAEGYRLNARRVKVGEGRKAFQRARGLLRRWGHFQLPWARACPADWAAPAAVGAPVCVVAQVAGFWALLPLKLLYEEEVEARSRLGRWLWGRRPVLSYALAHGTQKGHLLAGEERFQVEWDRRDNGVYYEVSAFSKPAHWLAVLGLPLVRRSQDRFGEESCRAVRAALAPPGAAASAAALGPAAPVGVLGAVSERPAAAPSA